MTFYCGIDLHAKKSQFCIIDGDGKKMKEGNLYNELPLILEFLDPFGKDVRVAIECTINWYWLVDGLKDAGYDVRLAHTLGLYMITGAKVKTDRRDAFKLAKLLRMGELPEAYIYPKEKRPLRDLLRRRTGLVQQRAECYSSLRVQFMKYNLNTMNGNDLKHLLPSDIGSMPIPRELNDYCIMTLERISLLTRQIDEIDSRLKAITLEDPRFRLLLTLPGVKYVLGLMIYYEIGDIGRFKDARQFASYCRLVPGIAQSADKVRKGRGRKQGNHYLKFAFTQAANVCGQVSGNQKVQGQTCK
ncbi:MAG: IS110 family transposase [Nitrospiraceae bacterium]|nr:IS110 family transposase [Nitrospiraceae bacterium]